MEDKLIVIDLGNGHGIQLLESEAKARGLLPEKKAMLQAENKMVEPIENKATPSDTEPKRKPVRK